MSELPSLENSYSVDQRQLSRLRWGMRAIIVIALGLLLLDTRSPILLLSYALALGSLELAFALVLRANKRLETRPTRWQQLYAVTQRLLTEPLNNDNLRSALESLAAVSDASQGSILLLDQSGQTRQFIHVGLPPGVEPITPLPADPGAWAEFLLPGLERTPSFISAPIVAGERAGGYLALANRSAGQPFTPQEQSFLQTFGAALGAALENERRLQATLRQVDLMAVLYQVSLATASSLEIDAVLVTIYEQCCRVMNTDAFYIALYEPQDDVVTYPLFFDRGQRVEPFSLPTDVGFAGWIVRNRRLLHYNDTLAESLPVEPYHVGGPPVRSYLGVPLIRREQVIGVMSAQSYQVGAYDQADAQLLTTLASQAAVAIENALLFQRTQRELTETTILAKVSSTIGDILTQQELLPYLADNLARILKGSDCCIVLRDASAGKLEATVAYNSSAVEQRGLDDGKLALAQTVIESMQPTLFGDAAYPAAEPPADQALIGLPLIVRGQAIGAAIIYGAQREQRQVERAMVVANQVAVAITNARLYAAEQRGREVAQTLLQIASDLSAALDLDKVLNLILERLRTVVPYESAAIGLLEGEVCYLAAAHDMARAQRLWGANLYPDKLPLVARVLNERAPVIVADTQQLDHWVMVKGSESIRSWLGVPLVLKDHVLGLLMLNHPTPAFYAQDTARLALAFAQHAAVAIENARLYEQAQAKLREQILLHEMTTVISSTLDGGQVLSILAEQLVTILGATCARIATLDEQAQTATVMAQHCSADAAETEQALDSYQTYDLKNLPVTAQALSDRQPLLITPQDTPEEWRADLAQRSWQVMLLLPLVVRDRVTGFVEILDSRNQRRFGESSIALAQMLTHQAAAAVDNARLFAETQRRLSEITLLYDIAVSSASTFDLDTVLMSVVKTLHFRVLQEAAVSVLILDQDRTEELQLRAHAGELEEIAYQTSLSIDEGIYRQAMREAKPILINDARQDHRCAVYGPDVRSILCVPLMARGQQGIGVLQALSTRRDAFSVHDQRLLRIMAGSLAIALENVRLFSQLKRSEETLTMRNWALRRTNDRLRELGRLKSAFVATVSHELRTPLNAIIGFSEVLIDGLAGELPPLAQEYSHYIRGSGKHLLELINDILDLSKIQAGKLTLNLESVDVMQVIVEDVQPTLTPLINKKGHTFNVAQNNVLPNITADRLRLKQILFNLISNAIKFTPQKGRIEVRALLAAPDTLRLDVQDNGPGISVQDQSLVFKEFRQAGQATRPGEGTGLGLSITRRLVELHGGRVWVESELGAGSTFIVLLPVSGPPGETQDRGEGDGRGAREEGEREKARGAREEQREYDSAS